MNQFTPLNTFLAGLSYAGRNPSKQEYLDGSPAQKRAIIARWEEIRAKQVQSDADWHDWAMAAARLGWASDQERAPVREFEQESAQSQWLRGAERVGPDTSEDQGL
jgi:hypothetical protein